MSAGDLRGLRLAVLAPISWPSPPPGYGPWEQVASDIADGMGARGLDVTLFATGNSQSRAQVSSVVPVGLNEDPALDGDVYGALHTAALFERAAEFDLIHNNFDWKPLTYALATKAPPMLTTIHGFSRPPILAAYYAAAERSFYCSISDSDRDPGLGISSRRPTTASIRRRSRSRHAWRLSRLPRPLPRGEGRASRHRDREARGRALEDGRDPSRRWTTSARGSRRTSTATACSSSARSARGARRTARGALALVHMTTRPERFGLVLVEAMACGTPVLGARMGSIPEIVVDGATGFLCDDVDDAVAKVPLLAGLNRAACRAHVEATFTVERMIDRYCDAYREALRLGVPAAADAGAGASATHDYWDRPMAFTELPPKPASL